ncbi:hypothetical protein RN09_0776 [Mycobacterium tuberculosis variant africanum]|nr:hypothetical protein RN09_0776 [Mycobacterium tuberculosis variant africanum]
MFGVTDHDASTIEDLLGGIPLAGFFAAGRSARSRATTRCTGLPRRWRCSSTEAAALTHRDALRVRTTARETRGHRVRPE